MRQRRAGRVPLVTIALAICVTAAAALQIQAFKNAPARPATAQKTHEQPAEPPSTPESRTQKALNEARANDGTLYAFLKAMPKGGDLHSHISGAVYAESLLQFAASSGLCLNRQSLALSQPPCTPGQDPAGEALSNPDLYEHTIDAWSMRGARTGGISGHDHFFDTFTKFNAAVEPHLPQILAEVVHRAAEGNVQYVELMTSPDHGRAAALGRSLGYDSDLAAMRQKLLSSGFADLVHEAQGNLDAMEQGKNAQLRCSTAPESHETNGCAVHVRYVYSVLRAEPPAQVFAQMLMGFELAQHDPRVVAVNLVQAEDSYLAMTDFHLHMEMLNYLKSVYPDVHITLHAGELKPGLVPPEGLRSHIRESIELGKAERIGHGVDVLYEDNPHELLAAMARRNVLVEICLTSNEEILGVKGKQHPLWPYLKAGVPVALATDDEGVSRSEMTREYERAVLEQGLDYETLKRMARNSLEHSFLPGASLWSDGAKFIPVRECAAERPVAQPGGACNKFLSGNEKAREQWRLEHRFAEFESRF